MSRSGGRPLAAVAALGALALLSSGTMERASASPRAIRPGIAWPAYGQLRRPSASQTPTPIFAGGGSAAALLWRAWGDNYGVPVGQPAPPSKPNVEELFASSNEGAGVRYILNQAFDTQNTPSNSPPYTDTTNGRNFTWPYPNVQSTPAPPDFTAGGSPFSQALLSQYATLDQKTRGPLLEAQIVGTSEALAYNLGPNSTLGSKLLTLSRKSYCGIFTGLITDWDNAQVTADNGGHAVVSASTPIELVYRTDYAGQTFITTLHLNAVCAAAGYPYSGGVTGTFTPPASPPAGSVFVGVSGSSAEEKEVLAPTQAPGALGYLSASFVQPTNPTGPPASNLINKAKGVVSLTVPATLAAIKNGPYVKAPSGYPTVKDAYLADPKGKLSYPITGFIWSYTYTCYPTTNPDVPAMKAFFAAALAIARGNPTAYDTIATNQGFAPLTIATKGTSLRKFLQIRTIKPGGSCK
jgi:ABC-type phosphate transport system substrate-binding protein